MSPLHSHLTCSISDRELSLNNNLNGEVVQNVDSISDRELSLNNNLGTIGLDL